MPAGHGPFAVWNRSGNRLVAALLRSPLHPSISGRLALITVTGRRSGHAHTLPVSYRQQGDGVEIPVMWPERKLWWRNLEDGAPVQMLIRGSERRGQGRVSRESGGATSVEVRLDPA
jgi:hypothetical protein